MVSFAAGDDFLSLIERFSVVSVDWEDVGGVEEKDSFCFPLAEVVEESRSEEGAESCKASIHAEDDTEEVAGRVTREGEEEGAC